VFLEILALETFPVPEVTLKDHSRLSAIISFDRLHLISYFFHATIIIVNNGVYTIVVPYVSNVAYNRPIRLGKNTSILTYFIMGINIQNNYGIH